MGNRLFGLDISSIVNGAIQGAGGVLTGTLTKVTPGTQTAGSLTGGSNPTRETHSFSGFVQDKDRVRIPGQLQTVAGRVVSVLGDSLPDGVEPSTNDEINIEDTDYSITAIVARDPAGALYECLVQA